MHVLARVLQVIDPVTAEAQMHASLDAAVARGDYRAASVTAGRLIGLYRESGRLAQALTLTAQKAGYSRQAGLGPWTQLYDKVQRLQVLHETGQASQVLAEVQRLRDRMRAWPATPGADETVALWEVHETLLATGGHAAELLGRHDDALALSGEVIASMRGRRAPAAAIARARFNDYGPLLRLGRTDEALDLLLDCRQAFEETHDIEMLGMTLSALADTEDERGHGDAATRLERDALRYSYLAGDVIGITSSYHNLGGYLRHHARQPVPALASHLASALICALTGAEGTDNSILGTANDLREFGAAAIPPADVPDLCRQLSDIPGTDLADLIETLSPDQATAEQTLSGLITQAQALAAAPLDDDAT